MFDAAETRDRAQEIADFLGVSFLDAFERLMKGFLYNHAEVAVDFKRSRPRNDDELLAWYLTTEAYIWELSAYHLDPGFNYAGMTQGVVEKLSTYGALSALVLGDGIGDVSMALRRAAISTCYHDLKGSKTARFAQFRHLREFGSFDVVWTDGWDADFGQNCWNSVIALDFMEHLPEPQVEKWATAIERALMPGGLFAAQNAFAAGDEEHGDSIPMHVSASNHYEYDWVPLMDSLGLIQVGDIWWMKPW